MVEASPTRRTCHLPSPIGSRRVRTRAGCPLPGAPAAPHPSVCSPIRRSRHRRPRFVCRGWSSHPHEDAQPKVLPTCRTCHLPNGPKGSRVHTRASPLRHHGRRRPRIPWRVLAHKSRPSRPRRPRRLSAGGGPPIHMKSRNQRYPPPAARCHLACPNNKASRMQAHACERRPFTMGAGGPAFRGVCSPTRVAPRALAGPALCAGGGPPIHMKSRSQRYLRWLPLRAGP